MSYNKKSKDKCILDNDFESAKENFEHTTNRYKEYWWEAIEQIYNKCQELVKKYVLDPIKKLILKVKQVTTKIQWNCTNELWERGSNLCYLIRAFDKKDNRLFSKMGMTTQSIETRMRQHLNYYKDVAYIIIDRVYQTTENAMGLESWFRAYYIKKHNDSFVKNDRFFNIDFNLQEADKIFNNYCEIC